MLGAMRRDQAMWRGGILIAVGVLIFALGVMRDWDLRYLKWGTVTGCAGLGILLLYGMFGRPKRDTPQTSHGHPV